MTDDTRKDQEKKDELTEKDLDQASGGRSENEGGHQYLGTEKPEEGRKR